MPHFVRKWGMLKKVLLGKILQSLLPALEPIALAQLADPKDWVRLVCFALRVSESDSLPSHEEDKVVESATNRYDQMGKPMDRTTL